MQIEPFSPPPFHSAGGNLYAQVKEFFSFWDRFSQYLMLWTNRLKTTLDAAGNFGAFPPIASASTIEPLQPVQVVTGSVAVDTIGSPPGITSITLLALDGFSLRTGSNIAASTTLPAGGSVTLFLNSANSLWYPEAPAAHGGAPGVLESDAVGLSAGLSAYDVTFSTPYADALYRVLEPSTDWNTTTWVTDKLTTGFTINFGNEVPPGGGNVEWVAFGMTGAAFEDGIAAVSAGDLSVTITFSIAYVDTSYKVTVGTDWNTTTWISNKLTTGFDVNFGTMVPVGGGHVDWRADA